MSNINITNSPIHHRHLQVVHYSSIASGSDDGSRSRSNSATNLNSPQDPSEYSNDSVSNSDGSSSPHNSPSSSPSHMLSQEQGGQSQSQGGSPLVVMNGNSNIDVRHQV